MTDEKDIFFEGIKVLELEIAQGAELFELVKLVDQPSYDENEALNFTYQLVCKVNFVYLGSQGLAIRIFVQLAFSDHLQLLGFVSKHLYDIDFIFNSFLIFLRFNVLFIGLCKLLTENIADYHNRVVSLLEDLAL